MQYKYVCKADAEKQYDCNGVSVMELPLHDDFPDIQAKGIRFFRCNLKAGCVMHPELHSDEIVILIFNGKRAFVTYGDKTFHVTEPAFFIRVRRLIASFAERPGRKEYSPSVKRSSYFLRSNQVRSFITVFSAGG